MERLHRLAVGRELKMIELKKELDLVAGDLEAGTRSVQVMKTQPKGEAG